MTTHVDNQIKLRAISLTNIYINLTFQKDETYLLYVPVYKPK